jgi:hypothetical protein
MFIELQRANVAQPVMRLLRHWMNLYGKIFVKL